MRHRTSSSSAVAAALLAVALAPVTQAHADEPRPALVVSELSSEPWQPGTLREDSLTFTNQGTAPTDGLTMRLRITRGLEFPEHAPGCTYATEAGRTSVAVCHFDKDLQPGQTFVTPVNFKVLPKALMENVEYGTGSEGGDPDAGSSAISYRSLAFTADNTADLAAVGDTATGKPGDKVTVTAALRNRGPGWVDDNTSDDQPAVMVHIPKGTTAVEVPHDCLPFAIDGPSGPSAPGKRTYVCSPQDHIFEVGSLHSYKFVLEIKDGAKDTTGEVKATSVYDIHPSFDQNPANDKAQIAIHVTGTVAGTGSGSSSGSTGTGTGGLHAQSTGRTGTTVATSSTVSSMSSTSSTTGGDATGTMASTGAGNTPLVAGIAAAAVALGGGLVFALRRRTAAKAD
ncbi:hypothetical protein AB0436_20200 [Streptomyces sp. NPDC051322]|uniref:hypothetical protein n=1 Tax=Streptomyces sp. NPDC051322 TaxID=3154645 RepID=UPI00344F9BBB